MTLRNLFENLAVETWNRVKDGAFYNVHQGETAITDDLLLKIVRLQHPAIRVLKTPQNEERNKGTDWEWWIGAPSRGWIRYAIQAKAIDYKTGRYDHLGHKVGDDLQTCILERFATANQAIPLYCFYNSVDRESFQPFWHCKRQPIEPEQLGCSITPLHVVQAALETRGRRDFDWLHTDRRSLPWRCLISCPAFLAPLCRPPDPDPDPDAAPDRFTAAAAEFFGKAPVLHPSLPLPFRDMREIREHASWQTDEFYQYLYNHDIGLYPRRVAVIDLSESEELSHELSKT